MGKQDKLDLIYDALVRHMDLSETRHNAVLLGVSGAKEEAARAHARIDKYENRFWGGVTVLSVICTTVGAIGATVYKKLLFIFA